MAELARCLQDFVFALITNAFIVTPLTDLGGELLAESWGFAVFPPTQLKNCRNMEHAMSWPVSERDSALHWLVIVEKVNKSHGLT